jgi:hypothetical protein
VSENIEKKYPTVGCCGLDCGLCPNHYTEGPSRCPGCGSKEFLEKHPPCGYITCCVKKHGLEVCGECEEFRCGKFDKWGPEGPERDSFISYQKVVANMDFIKNNGVKKFVKEQEKRIVLLEEMLSNYNDGRSKSFYCIASTVLPVADLKKALESVEKRIKEEKIKKGDVKSKAKILKEILGEVAVKRKVELKLRK